MNSETNTVREDAGGAAPAKRAPRRGFTLIEILVAVFIAILLLALLVGGVSMARRTAQETADRAAALAIKQGLTHFRNEFNFLPPLVKDVEGPLVSGGPADGQPLVYTRSSATDLMFLRTSPPASQPDLRFSIYSLPYYLVGALDEDGQPGPGFRTPQRDGTFDPRGRQYEPMVDLSGRSLTLYAPADAGEGRFELRDRNGIAIRYYRWEHGRASGAQRGEVVDLDDLNVPRIFGDPRQNTELRSAQYAIVLAGRSGVFGNEDQLPASHPQHMTLEEMRRRLGMNGDVGDAAFVQRMRDQAMSENVVEFGR